jgi:hypothetical protein
MVNCSKILVLQLLYQQNCKAHGSVSEIRFLSEKRFTLQANKVSNAAMLTITDFLSSLITECAKSVGS